MRISRYVPWSEIYIHIDTIFEGIKASGIVPNQIVGIQMGGLIPAILLAKCYGMRNITTAALTRTTTHLKWELSRTPSDDLLLVVDDIADSGSTLNSFAKFMATYFPQTRYLTATMLYKPTSTFLPTFYGLRMDWKEWTVFPWEQRERDP